MSELLDVLDDAGVLDRDTRHPGRSFTIHVGASEKI